VWLEQVPERYLENLDFATVIGDEAAGVSLQVKPKLSGIPVSGESYSVKLSLVGKEIISGKGKTSEKLSIKIPEPQLWSPEKPTLYDLKVELQDGGGKVIDRVQSYT
jgi:beta-galactosidase/beta-glucuronidase